MELNKTNTTEEQIKDLIKEIKKVDNMYLDKNNVLKALNKIVSKKRNAIISTVSYN
jgi:hypothetical protein